MKRFSANLRRHLRPFRRKLRTAHYAVRAGLVRRQGVRIGNDVAIVGRLRLNVWPGSSVVIGDRVVLNARTSHNTLEARGPVIIKTLTPHASISLGKDSGVTSVTLSAAHRIVIGDRVLIGAGTMITDSDHHVVRPPSGVSRRHLAFPEPKESDEVVIEDDAFIGARAIVLKGVRIGSNSVIGAGSVVVTNIPSGVVAAGNPARVIADIGR